MSTDIIGMWRRAITSKDGPESPITRYLLLCLAVRMEGRQRCSLLEKDFASDVRLSLRTIIDHLTDAEREGWLARRRPPRLGRIGQGYTYLPRFPSHLDEKPANVQEVHVGASTEARA